MTDGGRQSTMTDGGRQSTMTDGGRQSMQSMQSTMTDGAPEASTNFLEVVDEASQPKLCRMDSMTAPLADSVLMADGGLMNDGGSRKKKKNKLWGKLKRTMKTQYGKKVQMGQVGKCRSHKVREQYDQLFAKYQKVQSHKLQATKLHPLPPNHAAPKVAHILWPAKAIVGTVAVREHFVFKLFTRTPLYTRVERYSMFCSSMLIAFFFMTFYFKADCFMIPTPALCIKPKPHWFIYYFGWLIPNWATVLGSIMGIVTGSFPPFFLSLMFRKLPIKWKLTDDEKRSQMRHWWCGQYAAWSITALVNGFIIYWLIVFAHEYDWIIYRKFLNSVFQGFIHRLFTSPVGRMIPIAASLIGSKYCACCDAFLVFCCLHHIPVEKMAFKKRAGEDDESKGDEGDDDVDDAEEAGDVGEDGGGAGLAHLEIV